MRARCKFDLTEESLCLLIRLLSRPHPSLHWMPIYAPRVPMRPSNSIPPMKRISGKAGKA